jgi:acyl carrier protein
MTTQAELDKTIHEFLIRAHRDVVFNADTALFGGGFALDSLETVELSAVLEDELGIDPFNEGEEPQTVGDIYAFYKAAISQ